MHSHLLFAGNVFAHWVAAMSSVVSFTLGIVEYVRNRKTEGWVFAAIAFLFLIFAFDQAWQDEHRNADVLTAQKSSAISERDFWKSLSYQKDEAVTSLTELLAKDFTALTLEQQIAAKNLGAESDSQKALAELSDKIIDINKPIRQNTTPLALDKDDSKTPAVARFLLLTNTPVSPVDMTIRCDWAISAADLEAVGQGKVTTGYDRLSANTMRVVVNAPSWTPTLPFIADISYYHGGDMTCTFTLR